MTAAERKSAFNVELTHTFAAPRDQVFRAWTEPKQLTLWFGPPGYKTTVAKADLRVGGAYELALQPPQGPQVRIYGTFREVQPSERLSYTWSFDPPRESPVRDSLVTVEFRERGQWTDLVLRHEALPSEQEKQHHTDGWKGCFDRLGAHLGAP